MDFGIWTVYVWTRLDVILEVVSPLCFLSATASVVGMAGWIINYGDENERYTRMFKWKVFFPCMVWFLLCVATYIGLPSSKDFALMYAVPKIAQSRIVKEDIPDIYCEGINVLKRKLQEIDAKTSSVQSRETESTRNNDSD